MTTICGIETDKGVILGADTWISVMDASVGFTTEYEKVWKQGDFVLGMSGSLRMHQAVRFNLLIPDVEKDEELFEAWLCTDLVDAVRKALDQGGMSNGDEEWCLLFGYKNRLYCLDGSMAVFRSPLGFFAIGSGSEWALGSLLTTASINQWSESVSPSTLLTPETRLAFALATTANYDLGTNAPFIYADNFPYRQLTLIEGEGNA
jgi:ATP-dependent protease HslVU (ClpYQ) peptidase subunit